MSNIHPVQKIKDNYQKKIDKLIEIFTEPVLADFLKKDSEQVNPATVIENFFLTIDGKLLDQEYIRYQWAFKNFVVQLKCFQLRVFLNNRRQRFWNPLDEKFSEFSKNKTNADLDYYFADSNCIPDEIITRWLDCK